MQFTDWLTREIIPVNKALADSLDYIPLPCRAIASYIIDAGGKRMRPLLAVLCGRVFGYVATDIYLLGSSLEMLHAATLLHDDVLDNASLRRKKPAAHTVFGTPRAILAGDALLAAGNAIVCTFHDSSLTNCYSQATSQTAAGEIMEMESLGNPELELNQYLQIAKGKTGCLISQACAMGAIIAKADANQIEACSQYGENLGIAFQIVDDALDFSPEERTGKPRGGDLREGKMTPPLYFYRSSLTDRDKEIFDHAFSEGNFPEDYFMRIVNDASCFTPQVMRLASHYVEIAKNALAHLPACIERDILAEMADFVLARDK